MNKIIKQICLLFSFLLVMGGCNEDPEYYTLEAPVDQMKITASVENITLEKINEADDAITFSWNKATDRGANTKIAYYFRLYQPETKENVSELIRIEEGKYFITLSVRELNNMLDAWHVNAGEAVTVEAEVVAVVEESPEYMKPETSTTQFTAIGYDASGKLYLTIESNGTRRYIEMNTLEDGLYTWKGELDACNYWFVRDINNRYPAYMKGDSDLNLIYSPTGEGDFFTADRLGTYEITVDLNTLSITVSMTPINRLYLVTVKNGVEKITQLSEVEVSSDIFYMKDTFEEGTEFRFIRNQEILWPAFVGGSSNSSLELKEEGAAMFKVTKTATYVMTVNMTNMSLIFLDIYVSPTGLIGVVGNAITDVLWVESKATTNGLLTQKDRINKPEVISYTGHFTGNASGTEFKFLFESGWSRGLWAAKANSNPFNADDQLTSTDGTNDRKWLLPSGTASGIYTLELNLHTMKISLVKQ